MADRFLILTDGHGNYLTDEVTGDYLIVTLASIPIPLVPTSELVDYIFEFKSQGVAQHDSIIGPYFLQPCQGFDVLMFDRSAVMAAFPLPNYWIMISQPGPININLWNHLNLQLVINRSQEILGNASVLLDIPFPDTTVLSIMISGRGQHTAGGLFGAGQFAGTPLDGLIAEDGSTFLVAEDNSTFLVQE